MNPQNNTVSNLTSDAVVSILDDVNFIHIAHVIYALKTGGLENGLINLINRMPAERYQHSIVCITDYDEFAARIKQNNVSIFALKKKEGLDLDLYQKLWQLFRRIRPDIVHTRNLAALEAQIPAFLAGVPCRLHGEHGRGSNDPDGTVKKYQWIRKACRPFIHHFISLSEELETYLQEKIGILPKNITRICNGVDIEKFKPQGCDQSKIYNEYFDKDLICIGYVGRMDPIKDPLNLVKAFIILMRRQRNVSIRLIMIGNGPLRKKALAMLHEVGLAEYAWLPGERSDVAELMNGFDIYVLPSLAEGISNTLLEAMATSLPVVATKVGGNAELAEDEKTALLVPRGDPDLLAKAIERYVKDKDLRCKHGEAARQKAEKKFSIDIMVEQYIETYDILVESTNKQIKPDRKFSSSGRELK